MSAITGYRSAIFNVLARSSDDEELDKPVIQAHLELKAWMTDQPRTDAAHQIFECLLEDHISLNLDGLQLTALPPALSYCTPLKELILDNNQLNKSDSLPETLPKLSQLQTLSLNDNDLTAIPSVVMRIERLRHLQLMRNPRLSVLPPAIRALSNLKYLMLDEAGFRVVPFEITYLPALDLVSLRLNQITRVPYWVLQVFKGGLDLTGNPISMEAYSAARLALKELKLAGQHYPRIFVTKPGHVSEERPPLLDVAPSAKPAKPEGKSSPEIASS